MIGLAIKHKKEFVHLVKDIDCFEFEDIKTVQQIIL